MNHGDPLVRIIYFDEGNTKFAESFVYLPKRSIFPFVRSVSGRVQTTSSTLLRLVIAGMGSEKLSLASQAKRASKSRP